LESVGKDEIDHELADGELMIYEHLARLVEARCRSLAVEQAVAD
jgi:predicted methyltransferase MtxX (methanogen marker protein 4)